MSITVNKAGLQTTIQAGPRRGLRHKGVPASGACDPLSLALANKLVGNDLLAPALEATLQGPVLQFDMPIAFAITGAESVATLNGAAIEHHCVHEGKAGDILDVGSATAGARIYIAFAGDLNAQSVLGSESTYLPAAFGGFEGRALADVDQLEVLPPDGDVVARKTPPQFRVPMPDVWTIRACAGLETNLLDPASQSHLFEDKWTVARRADRMGMQLDGAPLNVTSGGRMPSAPVFPGTVQCTEGGAPFLLSVDAGTTGGYPRVAQLARLDRHLLGQVRPGDELRLLQRTPEEAIAELHQKHAYWRAWLPGIRAVI